VITVTAYGDRRPGDVRLGSFNALSTDIVEEMAELLKQKCPACPLIAISQTGRVDRKIAPDEIVIADHGPSALLEALERALRNRFH
jgi:hypothetical protein